jgi:acyl-[acyl-carrier-protein]-phospholipid O-acyltransferase/long-chain-fatty-acid--[acyl-carrier-protein] ligase
MMGYLKESEPGVLQPPADGWHDTGDVVVIDGDGFVTIVDRAGWFANIAGEKVSLSGVQQLVNSIWPGTLSVAVNLPCPKKGERIVVLTEKVGATLQEIKEAAKAQGLQELVVPSSLVIGKVPILGTGKIDFQSSKKVAAAA